MIQKICSHKLRGVVAHLAHRPRTSGETCVLPHNVQVVNVMPHASGVLVNVGHIAHSSGFPVQAGARPLHTLAICLNQMVSHLFGFFQ